jgi:3-hydroxybutyrate dehydrogenase
MIAQSIHHSGLVDILAYNAGIQHTAPVREFPNERWVAILAINLTSGADVSSVGETT